MSAKEPCPHQPELVTLLGREADGDGGRREHLGECAQCQAELGLLRAGFAALGDDPLGPDEAAQQRIAAQVMPQILAELSRSAMPEGAVPLRAASEPRPRGLPALRQLVLYGALATLAVGPAALVWIMRGAAPLKPVPALGLALLPLGLLPSLIGSPGLRRAALAFAIALTTALMLATVEPSNFALMQGAACLLLAASGSLLPAVVVLRAARKEQASALSGALLGAAIGSGGAALQRLLCGIDDLSHALVFHLGPFLFFIALAGLLGSGIARSTAPSGPVAQQAG